MFMASTTFLLFTKRDSLRLQSWTMHTYSGRETTSCPTNSVNKNKYITHLLNPKFPLIKNNSNELFCSFVEAGNLLLLVTCGRLSTVGSVSHRQERHDTGEIKLCSVYDNQENFTRCSVRSQVLSYSALGGRVQ